MKYDYWKMRGWTLVKTDDDKDDDFDNIDDIVKSIDDIFDILEEELREGNPFVIEINTTAKDAEDEIESTDDAYDRAMKGL